MKKILKLGRQFLIKIEIFANDIRTKHQHSSGTTHNSCVSGTRMKSKSSGARSVLFIVYLGGINTLEIVHQIGRGTYKVLLE